MTTLTESRNYSLGRLPYEPWLRCLQFAGASSSNGALPFLAVCPLWSQTILEEPELWTTIVLDNYREDEAVRLNILLQLSRDHLLDVVLLKDVTDKDKGNIQIILSHAQRIRSIIWPQEYRNNDSGDDILIRWLIEGAICYPKMLTIDTWRLWSKRWDAVAAICPNLQFGRGFLISANSIICSKLQEGEVRPDSLDDTIIILQKTRLKSLRLDYSSIQISESQLNKYVDRLNDGLLGGLNNLHLRLGPQNINHLSSLITALPQLRSLALVFFSSPHSQTKLRVQPLSADQIKHISSLSITWAIQPSQANVDELLSIFITDRPLDFLYSFRLSSAMELEPATMHSLLCCLAEVRSLDLNINRRQMQSEFPSVMLKHAHHLSLRPSHLCSYVEAPNLNSASLRRYSASEFYVPKISSSTISHLVVDTALFDRINDSSPTIAIEERWPSLQLLRLVVDPNPSQGAWCKTLIGVRSLREVNFDSTRPILDGFLLDMLENPTACPNLNTIKSSRYPTWELLFEILRCRNKLNHKSIKQLSLLAYPAPPILTPLVLLLQGRSDIHTRKNISEVIYRRGQDYYNNDEHNDFRDSFQLCRSCILSGYSLCSSDGVGRTPKETSQFFPLDPLELYEDESISSARSIDTKKFESLRRDRILKAREYFLQFVEITDTTGDCARHRNPVEITGSTPLSFPSN